MALIQVSTLYLLLLIAVHAHAYYLPFENTVSPNEPDEDLLHSILQELIKSELAAKVKISS